MYPSTLLLIPSTLLLATVAAQDIDSSDVPSQCQTVCAPVVSLTSSCDSQFENNDAGQLNCVCSAQNAASAIPACEACLAIYSGDDGHDNDAHDLLTKCSFTTTTYVTSGTGVATATTTEDRLSSRATTSGVGEDRTSARATTGSSSEDRSSRTASAGTTEDRTSSRSTTATSGTQAAAQATSSGGAAILNERSGAFGLAGLMAAFLL